MRNVLSKVEDVLLPCHGHFCTSLGNIQIDNLLYALGQILNVRVFVFLQFPSCGFGILLCALLCNFK